MQKTPDEIKKGLECCADSGGTCEECPYADGECRAFEQIAQDALALIRRLEAEQNELLEQLKKARVCELCKFDDIAADKMPCAECAKTDESHWEWCGSEK